MNWLIIFIFYAVYSSMVIGVPIFGRFHEKLHQTAARLLNYRGEMRLVYYRKRFFHWKIVRGTKFDPQLHGWKRLFVIIFPYFFMLPILFLLFSPTFPLQILGIGLVVATIIALIIEVLPKKCNGCEVP